MKQEIGKALLVVFTEADPQVQGKSSEWFTKTHIPERMQVPGFLSARRFELVEGSGAYKYLNIYELTDESVLHGEGYAKSVATCTPPVPPAPRRFTSRCTRAHGWFIARCSRRQAPSRIRQGHAPDSRRRRARVVNSFPLKEKGLNICSASNL